MAIVFTQQLFPKVTFESYCWGSPNLQTLTDCLLSNNKGRLKSTLPAPMVRERPRVQIPSKANLIVIPSSKTLMCDYLHRII